MLHRWGHTTVLHPPAVADWAWPSVGLDQLGDEVGAGAIDVFRGKVSGAEGSLVWSRSPRVTPDHCAMSRALGSGVADPGHSSDPEVFCRLGATHLPIYNCLLLPTGMVKASPEKPQGRNRPEVVQLLSRMCQTTRNLWVTAQGLCQCYLTYCPDGGKPGQKDG